MDGWISHSRKIQVESVDLFSLHRNAPSWSHVVCPPSERLPSGDSGVAHGKGEDRARIVRPSVADLLLVAFMVDDPCPNCESHNREIILSKDP